MGQETGGVAGDRGGGRRQGVGQETGAGQETGGWQETGGGVGDRGHGRRQGWGYNLHLQCLSYWKMAVVRRIIP